jgi:hypothetical protein
MSLPKHWLLLRPYGCIAPKTLSYLAFQSFNFERTWWGCLRNASYALILISTFLWLSLGRFQCFNFQHVSSYLFWYFVQFNLSVNRLIDWFTLLFADIVSIAEVNNGGSKGDIRWSLTALILISTFLWLSLGRFLCWWTVSPRGYHPPSSQCFGNDMAYYYDAFLRQPHQVRSKLKDWKAK